MQNQYVGDIGDLGKYGLLREIFGRPEVPGSGCGLRLGVAWYLFPDKKDKKDGKFTDYLRSPTAKDRKRSECDPELYLALRRLVRECNRNVFSVCMSGILPRDTVYHDRSLSYEPRESGDSRKLRRAEWLNSALAATAKADVVFVDPDNGIASEKVSAWRKNGPKYALLEDLRQFYVQGNSLVIYHHLGRLGTVEEQINCLAKRLQESLGLSHLPWSLWYHRGTGRGYFIVAQERRRVVL